MHYFMGNEVISTIVSITTINFSIPFHLFTVKGAGKQSNISARINKKQFETAVNRPIIWEIWAWFLC